MNPFDFITLSDHTEWQKNFWKDKTVDEIFYDAKHYDENMNKEG
jgi:hypothetical protein